MISAAGIQGFNPSGRVHGSTSSASSTTGRPGDIQRARSLVHIAPMSGGSTQVRVRTARSLTDITPFRKAGRQYLRPSPLSRLPGELLQNIASHLSGSDTLAMAMTSKRIKSYIEPEAKSARIARNASKVATLAEFVGVLGPADTIIGSDKSNTIRSLPLRLQAEPLRQLTLRIYALPSDERLQALQALQEMVSSLADEYKIQQLVVLAEVARYF